MSNDPIVCQHCRFGNPVEALFCGNCGRALAAAPPVQNSVAAGVPCPHCGASNLPEAVFCGECGRSMTADQRPGEDSHRPATNQQPLPAICPHCGAPHPPDAVFCGICGRSLAAVAYVPTAFEPAMEPAGRNRWLPALGLVAGLVFLLAGGAFLINSRPNLPAAIGLPFGPTAGAPAQTASEPPPSLTNIPVTAEAVAGPTDENETGATATPPRPTPLPALEPTVTPIPPPSATPEPTALPPGELIVSAAARRTETGLRVAAGQTVEIEVLDGGWRGGPLPTWPIVGPEGDPQVPGKSTFPVASSPLMALVGGVGTSRPRIIGGRATFISDAGGELWLGPNDDGAADNAGELRVRVTLGEIVSFELTPLAGDGLVRLTFGPERDYTPTLSPDQSSLVFSSEIGGAWQLVAAGLDGSEESDALTSGSTNYQAPDFSPDGRTLLVASDRDGDYDIYQVDSAGGAVIDQLTDLPGDEYFPRWLRDGSGFVFSWQQNDVEAIYRQRLGGAPVELVRATTFDGFGWPSPDGAQVAFYSGRDGDYEIYVMNSDGGDPRRLTVSSGRDASPTWSPDGQWIAFESARNGSYDLYLVRPDGSDLRQLTSGDDNDWFPIFSPDGQWLLFQSDRAGNMDIFRMPFEP